VTAALVALLLAGMLTVATVQPASSLTRRAIPPQAKFTISSFNVLGASHTPPGGDMASGTTRIVWANQLLDLHHVDVVGFQEMQAVQMTKFLDITDGRWAVFPGLAITRGTENSIGWRTDKFELVEATTVGIPYFDGNRRPMPIVLLRHKKTGLLSYFANFHNPADTATYTNQGKWRAEATRIEIALQNQLQLTGIPRFMTGDMNERATYFCRVTKESPVTAAARGGYWLNNICYANKPRAVDWIFGAKGLTWSNYLEDRSDLVDKTTDHPVIVSDVTVDSARFPRTLSPQLPAPLVPAVSY
jgi:hypothetical protein